MSPSPLKVAACGLAALALGAGMLAPSSAQEATDSPKNVILLIGDGMGYNYLDLYNAYETGEVHYQVETGGDKKAISATLLNSAYSGSGFQSWKQLSMQTNWLEGPAYNPNAAWANFDWVKDNPTDSAAAGTAMATGVKTYNSGLGVNAKEQTVENLSERAKSLGKAVGVVTSVQYSHATPAAFSAHSVSRNNYLDIAHQQVYGDLDVVMGAGHPWYDKDGAYRAEPSYKYMSEDDYRTLSTGATDFTFVEDNADFEALTQGQTPERVFGVAQVATTLQQARTDIDTPNSVVDLPTMTTGALNVLDNDEDGFFLMVEGGAIDWTGHANQTERALEETTDFFEAVESVNRWVEENSSWDETLVIVTADHETGYLMGDPQGGFHPMVPQGVGVYPTHSWNSGDHTNMLVPFFVKGAGTDVLEAATIGRDQIRGRYLDNTALASWLLGTAWVEREEPTPAPTAEPTVEPTAEPTTEPTVAPTSLPTAEPTAEPTVSPSLRPSPEPSQSQQPAPTGGAEPTATPGKTEQPGPAPQDGGGTAGGASDTGKKPVLAHTGASLTGLSLGALLILGLGTLALVAGRKKEA